MIPSDLIPQADHFDKLFDVLEVIESGKISNADIAAECGLSARQGGYYRLALQSLRLISVKDGRPTPTALGQFIADLEDNDAKHLIMRGLVLLNPAVRLVFTEIESARSGVAKGRLADLIRSSSNLSRSTADRRVDTILRWLAYLRVVRRVGLKYSLVDDFIK